LGSRIIPATCENSWDTWDSLFNARSTCWRAPTKRPANAGSAVRIPASKKTWTTNAALIYEDEATFRQDATLHRTWARRGCPPKIPTTGERRSVKIFGCIDIYSAQFYYHRDTAFNATTYLDFLEQIARRYYPGPVLYIQDNASYHKDQNVWAWFKANRYWWEVYNLPPYWPELNATERLWHHIRLNGAHNRYFSTVSELNDTLVRAFRSIQRNPRQLYGYLQPFL